MVIVSAASTCPGRRRSSPRAKARCCSSPPTRTSPRRPRRRWRSSRHEGACGPGRRDARTCEPSAASARVLCEGGPHLHAELIEAGLVDELFVTHAPKLIGGEGPGLVAGLPERERRLARRLAAGGGRRALRPLSRAQGLVSGRGERAHRSGEGRSPRSSRCSRRGGASAGR